MHKKGSSMSDRVLVTYEEDRLPEGPHWTLTIERSAEGAPGLLLTIKSKMHDPDYQHIEALNREMTIVVNDGEALLEPVLAWLKNGPRRD